MGTEPGIWRRLLREVRQLPWSVPNTASGVRYRLRHGTGGKVAPAAALDEPQQGSFAPLTASGPPSEADAVVRVTCWNIAYGRRYEQILSALHQDLSADILVLQEVDLCCRRSGYRDVCRDLARELGLHFVFGTEFQDLAQQRGAPALHGQAILSRFPISTPRLLRFSHQHDWSQDLLQPRHGGRMALVADLQVGSCAVRVYNTHLESRSDIAGRTRQMQEIMADIEAHPTAATVLIAGDLNTREAERDGISRVTDVAFRHGFLDAAAACTSVPPGISTCLDWILVRGAKPLRTSLPPTNTGASDHEPVVARLRLF